MRQFLVGISGCVFIASVRASVPSNAVVDGAQTACYNTTGTVTNPSDGGKLFVRVLAH